MFDLQTLGLIALACGVACIIQGAIGFGLGLFAVPLLVFFGLELSDAICVMLVVVMVQTGYNTWQYRKDVPWSAVWPHFALRMVFTPLGILTLSWLEADAADAIKPMIGVTLLLIIVTQAAFRPQPREHIAWPWTVLAGAASGLMAGVVGMGGPALVLWLMALDWPSRRTRSFLWCSFLLMMPFQIGFMFFEFGSRMGTNVLAGLIITPVTLACAYGGMKLGERLNRKQLKIAAYVLLVLIALWSIIAPLVG